MSIPRKLFSSEHTDLRESVQRFLAREVAPFYRQWEKDGRASRTLWEKAGEAGFLAMRVPEEYGGGGGDLLHSVVFVEELSRSGFSLPGLWTHSDIIVPYIVNYGSEEQKAKWLPRCCAGTCITSVAMTEPGAGSDLGGIVTTAVKHGDHYLINGQKTFITNGYLADLVVLVANTKTREGKIKKSLFLVEAGTPGFSKGEPLEKVGQKAQDTAELFFSDVRIPAENLLGAEGNGYRYLFAELAWERLIVAVAAVASAESALAETVDYAKQRKAFAKALIDMQQNAFKLAELTTEVQMARVFIDRCLELALDGDLDAVVAAMSKYWSTDLLGKVVDAGVQIHGGYGYMWEYSIARAYADARAQRIYAGTNDIMKHIIAGTL